MSIQPLWIKLHGLEILRRAGSEVPREEGRVGTGRQQRQDNRTIIPPRKLPPNNPRGPDAPLPLGEHWPFYMYTVPLYILYLCTYCTSSNPSRAPLLFLADPRPRSWLPFSSPSTRPLNFSSVFSLMISFLLQSLHIFSNISTSIAHLAWIHGSLFNISSLPFFPSLSYVQCFHLRAFVLRWISALWSQSPGVIHLHKMLPLASILKSSTITACLQNLIFKTLYLVNLMKLWLFTTRRDFQEKIWIREKVANVVGLRWILAVAEYLLSPGGIHPRTFHKINFKSTNCQEVYKLPRNLQIANKSTNYQERKMTMWPPGMCPNQVHDQTSSLIVEPFTFAKLWLS